MFSFKGYLHEQSEMTPINKLLNPNRDLKAKWPMSIFLGCMQLILAHGLTLPLYKLEQAHCSQISTVANVQSSRGVNIKHMATEDKLDYIGKLCMMPHC